MTTIKTIASKIITFNVLFTALLFFSITPCLIANTTIVKGESKITHLLCNNASTSINGDIDLREYWENGREYDAYAFIKVNLAAIPKYAVITDVKFKLYYKGSWGYGSSNVFLGKTDCDFNENLSWSTYNGTNLWPSGVADGIDGYVHTWTESPGGMLDSLLCKIYYSVAGLNTGMTHTVSAWVLGKYWGAKAKLTVMDANNNVIHTESFDNVPNNDYKRIQFNFTPTTTSLKIILSDDGSVQGTRLYWDFIELEAAYNN
jgi:hypothetical protein